MTMNIYTRGGNILKPIISVGTRAFNAENTIAQTLESVLSQTMIEFEYWIVNNGSTDRTGNIINEYAEKDNRICVIHLEDNKPEFSTMNMLVENGKGDFFMLLDSDDWLEPNFMNELYINVKKYNVDVAIGGSKFHFIESSKVGFRKSNICGAFYIEQMPEMYIYLHQFFRPIWGKIFSAEVVKKQWKVINEKRPKYLKYGGDTFTCFELLKGVEKLYISDEILHNYRCYTGSSSFVFNTERFKSDVFLLEHAIEYLNEFGIISEKNLMFVYGVYCNAIRDTIKVLFNSKMLEENKLKYLEIIFEHYHTKQLFKEKYLVKELRNLICEVIDYISKIVSTSYKVFRMILDINPILYQSVDHINFIKSYGLIVKLIINENYEEAFIYINDELLKDNYITNKYKIDLLNLIIKLSALLGKPETFVSAHKQMVIAYIECKKIRLAIDLIKELEEMVPNDLDVLSYKQKINLYNDNIFENGN